MASFFHMGHDTENLVGAEGLQDYAGLILSPVNRAPHELKQSIGRFRKLNSLEIIFDSQLYFPRIARGKLEQHPYFTTELDTLDLSSPGWWRTRIGEIVRYSRELGVDTICSPTLLPGNNRWSPGYFESASVNYQELQQQAGDFKTLMTLIVSWEQMDTPDEAMRIASIVTKGGLPQGIYLVLVADVEPRRELANDQRLLALMKLVSSLESAGVPVLASHCCTEMVLIKAAGATHCATGKFFNLRRFTRSRFEEDEEGGGRQIPYWIEHSLLAFLREADVRRLMRTPDLRSLIAAGPSNSSFATEILSTFTANEGTAWLGLSWRQYLAWFAATERTLSSSDRALIVSTWLKNADANWETMDEEEILFDERKNDGAWVRNWRQALAAFRHAP